MILTQILIAIEKIEVQGRYTVPLSTTTQRLKTVSGGTKEKIVVENNLYRIPALGEILNKSDKRRKTNECNCSRGELISTGTIFIRRLS